MEQLELLRYALETLERLAIPYALVGSWGSGIYGEPRFTRDIDVVADLTMASVPGFCVAFPNGEFYLSEIAVREAVRDRFQFNVIHPASGNKIDFIMTRDEPWHAGQVSRRRRVTFGTGEQPLSGFVAAPEDVILGKLWYYSEGGGDRHLRDIAGILRVTGDGVDRAEVERWARQLGYLEIWRAVVEAVDAPDRPPGAGCPMRPGEILPQVYEELRGLAAAKLATEKPGQTLDATGLVHEAFLKLGGDRSFATRTDYLKAAAIAMRRILVDRARARDAAKRGGGRRVELESHHLAVRPADDFEALDAALSRLAIEHPRIAELIQLRYFGGSTLAECAEALDVSERTADTWWAYGRAWLAVALKEP